VRESIVAPGKVLGPEEHPTFIETWKEMEKLLETGALLLRII
jgi:glycerol 2-dehydrogenase (NADP+)